MSEQDIARVVEDAIVNTMGSPDQTEEQRRISLEEARYDGSENQVRAMHSLFKDWRSFEEKHPRRWYHWLGIGATWEPSRAMTIDVVRMSAEGAIEQACGISSATANRQAEGLDANLSGEQIASTYAMIDQDVASCMENRRDSIKSLKEMSVPPLSADPRH